MKRSAKTRTPLERKPLHNPGESIQQERSRLMEEEFVPAIVVALCAILAIAWEWSNWYFRWPRQPVAVSLAALCFVGYGAYKFVTIRRRMARLRLGLEGEKFVGQYLEHLRSAGCQVFHDVVGQGFNIDHVVVAPQGVFVIETKTRSKPVRGPVNIDFDGERILVNGLTPDRDPVLQVRRSVRWLHEHLVESTAKRFPIKGVLVFPGWFINDHPHQKSDIWVLNHKTFPAFLRHEPVRLQPEDVALVSSRIVTYMQAVE